MLGNIQHTLLAKHPFFFRLLRGGAPYHAEPFSDEGHTLYSFYADHRPTGSTFFLANAFSSLEALRQKNITILPNKNIHLYRRTKGV